METKTALALTKLDRMVWVDGGTFMMGSDHYYPEEAPTHQVTVGSFWIDPAPVTNAQFASFLHFSANITLIRPR